jgi:hypothetical protein
MEMRRAAMLGTSSGSSPAGRSAEPRRFDRMTCDMRGAGVMPEVYEQTAMREQQARFWLVGATLCRLSIQ